MSTPNNIPAFPIEPTYNPDGSVWYHGKDGMELRDYFAAAALPSVVGNRINVGAPGWQAEAAWSAYSLADAMLAERRQGKEAP